MCGITACVSLGRIDTRNNLEKERKRLTSEIDQSLDIVKHRGPDARGKWISNDCRVGYGHVRLSIIDLSPEGNQPFHDEKDDVHAVVNGELYDHDRYRTELSKDYDFKGQSDCEIVLALYQRYGLTFVSHLRGEFAFCLWDAKRQLFFAGRDRYGIKSLYYTIVDGRLLVATEMKSFMAFGWKPEWDVVSIMDGGWRCDDRTVFRDVKKIMPGHYLLKRNSRAIVHEPYWELDYPDKRIKETRTEEEMIQGVRESLIEAVRLRLRADVPVGVYLSGGLDSSAVAGMVAHLMKEKGTKLGDDGSHDLSRLRCFTVQFDKDSGADESDVAERTAQQLGIKFIPIHCDEKLLAEKFEEATWCSESPTPSVNGPAKIAMAERVNQEGLKVVVTGEGSDEHFGGYPYYQSDLLSEPDYSWATSKLDQTNGVNGYADNNMKFFNDVFKGTYRHGPPSTAYMLNNATMGGVIAGMPTLPTLPWTASHLPDVNQDTILPEAYGGLVRDKIVNKWHPFHTAQYLFTKTVMHNLILRFVGDNVDMLHHVESRTPFLDHKVCEYANGIPPSLKMKYNPHDGTVREKYILREAMKPFITDEVYNRKKQPFLGPATFPAGGPLQNAFAKLITKENVEQLGFVDWEPVKDIVRKAFEEKDAAAYAQASYLAQFVVLAERFGVKRVEEADYDGFF